MDEQLKKAWQLFDEGKFEESERVYLNCLTEVVEADHETYQSILMGLIYTESFMGKFDAARGNAKCLKDMAESQEEMHIAIHQAGMIERMAENYEEALKLFDEEARIIHEVFPTEDMLISANLYEQAYVNLKMKDLERAQNIMLLSLAHAKKAEDNMCIGCACRGLGEIMMAMNEIEYAKKYFSDSIEAFENAGDFIAVEEVKDLLCILQRKEEKHICIE